MSTQDPLFHDDFNDALANAVKALGKQEVVARQLWGPSKPRAGQYLSDCLNRDREAKFSIQEIVELLKMFRAKGIHWAMHALCEEVGYSNPDIVPLKTKGQERAEQMAQLVAEFKRLADEQAAETNANLRAVS
jgi:hypothetical protein